MTNRAELLAAWRREEGGQPLGWDFSALSGRMSEDDEPWNYIALASALLRDARSALDLGTGGGELLSAMAAALPQGLPKDTVATEGWESNVPVAREALRPLGVEVIAHDYGIDGAWDGGKPSPLPDARFDLVLSRHESFDAADVARILAPGGHLLTQQVGGDELGDLWRALGHEPRTTQVALGPAIRACEAAGLEVVDSGECVGAYRFSDVAALIAYLRLVPWDVPEDFCVDAYADQLLALHQAAGGCEITAERKRFWLLARRL